MNASKIANAEKSFRILIMGLPGSGKTTLAEKLKSKLPAATHLNADEVRKAADDWDFSAEGRLRQAARMKDAADAAGGMVIADFVCPTPETRAAFAPHVVILMDTIEAGRFEDTNAVFTRPAVVDYVISSFNYSEADVVHAARWIVQAQPQGIMVGRFQPFHGGHKALVDKILEKHHMCCIMVRTVPASNGNPLGVTEVVDGIQHELQDPKYRGRYNIMVVPNVAGVYYGRDVGYEIEQIDLPADIQAISATAIRKERGISLDRENG